MGTRRLALRLAAGAIALVGVMVAWSVVSHIALTLSVPAFSITVPVMAGLLRRSILSPRV